MAFSFTGLYWTLLALLFVFEFSFLFQIVLWFFLLFLITFIFLSSSTHDYFSFLVGNLLPNG